MQTSWILLIFFALVVAIGGLYLYRPQAELKPLTIPEPSPLLSSPIDNTVKIPAPSPSPPSIQPITQAVHVTLKTNKGDIEVELNGKVAPLTVGNFVQLAQNDFYDGTTFHRVIPDFMIQGGDPFSKDQALRSRHGTGGPGYMFKDEINAEKIVRGTMAMANAGPNTNGSQFFIVTAPATPFLDGKHTYFGKVIKGMEIVGAISLVERDDNDNPVQPVIITDIVVLDAPVNPLKVVQ